MASELSNFVNKDMVNAALPDKGFWEQVDHGIYSYFQGLGWSLTVATANRGWLGPELQAQAADLNQAVVQGLAYITQHPGQAGSVAAALVQKYPFQVGARLATGLAVSKGTGPVIGVSTASLAGAGNMYEAAHSAGNAAQSAKLLMGLVLGQPCGSLK